MQLIGKVKKHIIQKLYDEFRNVESDLKQVKSELLNIITTYCELNNIITSCNIDDYFLNKCTIYGLKMNIKNCDNVIYMFCIKTGKIYYTSNTNTYIKQQKCFNIFCK